MLKVTKIASCGGVDFLHTQITQNKIFAKSLWYLKKKWGMMLNFCADEYQIFYQLMLSILMGMTKHA